MIETKDEAIKHLKDGKSFSLKIFDDFRDDKEVALAAVSQDGNSIRYCSDKLRDDKKVALAAVNQNGFALRYCSDKLRDDKEVVTAAVSQIGLAFEYCSPRLRDDKEVVTAAVNQYGYILQHCSEKLRDDKEVALAAVSKDGISLQHCSESIQKLCQGQDPIEALTKAIESEKLHAQLQKEIKPKDLDFAKSLSAECKQNTMEQSSQVAKARPKMKI